VESNLYGSIVNNMQSVFPIAWYICLQNCYAWGFLAEVGLSLVWCSSSISLNLYPMNLLPWYWIQSKGLGYLDSQVFSKCIATWAAVFLSVPTISTRFGDHSIYDGQSMKLEFLVSSNR
jgi:hypothetical protein